MDYINDDDVFQAFGWIDYYNYLYNTGYYPKWWFHLRDFEDVYFWR